MMPMIVCAMTIAVVTAATEGGLLNELIESAMYGESAQNGSHHKTTRDTPSRSRRAETVAVSCSSMMARSYAREARAVS